MTASLTAWLARSHPVAPDGREPEPPVEQLHCHPDLVERVDTLVRGLRGVRRVFIDGCPVYHHPSGPPFAAAFGTSGFAVRSDDVDVGLRAHPPVDGLPPGWVSLDPWLSDITFLRSTDLLRQALHRAYEQA